MIITFKENIDIKYKVINYIPEIEPYGFFDPGRPAEIEGYFYFICGEDETEFKIYLDLKHLEFNHLERFIINKIEEAKRNEINI